MDKEDKLKNRYEILDELIELLSHGEAKVTWADKTIVKIEKIVSDADINR